MKDWKELLLLLCVLPGVLFAVSTALNAAGGGNVRCAGNLRILYGYAGQYQRDHGVLPPVTIPMKPLWQFWSTLLRKYSQDRYEFICPADPRAAFMFEKRRSPLYSPREFRGACYGMNYFLNARAAGKMKKQVRLDALSRPAGTVFLGDSKGPYMLPPRFWTYEKAFRHQDARANFLYADGHVKMQKQTDFGRFEGERFITDFTKWHWN